MHLMHSRSRTKLSGFCLLARVPAYVPSHETLCPPVRRCARTHRTSPELHRRLQARTCGQRQRAAYHFAAKSRKPGRCTVAFAASLAGMRYREVVSSAGNAPLSNAAARATHPASLIWVRLR